MPGAKCSGGGGGGCSAEQAVACLVSTQNSGRCTQKTLTAKGIADAPNELFPEHLYRVLFSLPILRTKFFGVVFVGFVLHRKIILHWLRVARMHEYWIEWPVPWNWCAHPNKQFRRLFCWLLLLLFYVLPDTNYYYDCGWCSVEYYFGGRRRRHKWNSEFTQPKAQCMQQNWFN